MLSGSSGGRGPAGGGAGLFPASRSRISGDQGGVRGALPGVALEQARRGVQQEPQQRAVGFGQVQRALKGAPGGGRVAERVPGDRLQQEGLDQPGPPAHSGGAVQDRRERHGRRVRVVLGEPQHRGGDAHLPAVAVAFAESG